MVDVHHAHRKYKRKREYNNFVGGTAMLNIGCHLSASKGYESMGKDAIKIGANTFQFFTRNPRGSKAKEIDENDMEALLEIIRKNKFTAILGHAPYTLNPCSADENIREFTTRIMAEDLGRMEYLPNNFYNFHPGNHIKQGVEVGIKYIVNMLNTILRPEQTTIVLLETMAGKGTEIGRRFEELKQIISDVDLSDKMGVCFDTCHVYDAGYDIVNDLDGVLDEFDRIIGLDKLYAIHLNDSKNPFASHKDRHEKIGKGYIGKEAIIKIINHPKLRHLPFILETPNELSGYGEEIKMLREAYRE
jgi:deoxyribonuclease-4